MSEFLAYLNGQFLPASQAQLPVSDLGLVQGATVTEMVRTFHHQPFRLEAHLDRLFHSLRYVGLEIPHSLAELSQIADELITRNASSLTPDDDLGLVLFVTAGEHPMYAAGLGHTARTAPTVCLHTFPLPFQLWADRIRRGAHVITPSIRQVPVQCVDPRMKCRSRMHYYLAEHEVRQADPEAFALLLDLEGCITETNAANFLLVERGVLVSPPLATALPGISRAVAIELAGRLGIPFVERALRTFDVLNADEAMLSSTPYCLMPVSRLNGRSLGDARPGPVYDRLIAAWSELVGTDIRKQILDGAGRHAARKGSHGTC